MIYNLQKNINNIIEGLLGFLISLFIFISYIKHTISLNYIILALMSILMLYIFKKSKCHYCHVILDIKKPLLFISIFIIWILFQPILVANDIFKTYGEIKGQLLVPFLYLIIGIFLILLNYKILTPKKVINIIFLTGFSHIIIIIVLTTNTYFQAGHLPVGSLFSDGG